MDSLDFVLEKRTEELELGNFGSCAQPDVDAEVVVVFAVPAKPTTDRLA